MLYFLKQYNPWKFTPALRDNHKSMHTQAKLIENISSEEEEGKRKKHLKVVIEKSWGTKRNDGIGLCQNITYLKKDA